MKRLLYILSRPPYAGSHAVELLETAMVGAVFDLPVSLLLRADGVWAAVSNQQGAAAGQRTVGKVLSALPTYDIERIYVCAASARERGLERADLCVPAEMIDAASIGELIAGHDAVLSAQS